MHSADVLVYFLFSQVRISVFIYKMTLSVMVLYPQPQYMCILQLVTYTSYTRVHRIPGISRA